VLFTQTKLLKALNMNPKLRFQNGVGTEFSCSKHSKKNLKSRNLKLRIIMHFLHWVLARTTKSEPKNGRILNQPVCDLCSHLRTHIKMFLKFILYI